MVALSLLSTFGQAVQLVIASSPLALRLVTPAE